LTDPSHVLWIGGAPGTGKTTVATIVMRCHGLRLYSADTRTWIHRDRAIRAGNAAAIRWESISRDERLSAPDDELIAMSLHHERGAMVLADIADLPDSPLVLAEGSVIRPAELRAGASAIWLVNPADEQARRLRERDGDSNRLYELLHREIGAEVAAAGARVVEARDIETTVAAVDRAFAPLLARGPVAASVAERRALVREANLAIVDQVRGYYARPWASGDPEAVVRSFVCECADRACVALVDVPVGMAASESVVAAGHTLIG